MSASIEASPEWHRWTLSGHRVTQVCVHPGAVRVQSWSLQDSLEIRVAVPFSLRLIDGTERTVDPDAPEQLAPLLTLLNRTIDEMEVTRTGELSTRFSDGTVIIVVSHSTFEAFEVQGGGALEGLAYLARPGGGQPWE